MRKYLSYLETLTEWVEQAYIITSITKKGGGDLNKQEKRSEKRKKKNTVEALMVWLLNDNEIKLFKNFLPFIEDLKSFFKKFQDAEFYGTNKQIK